MSQQAGALNQGPDHPTAKERRVYIRYLRLREARVRTGSAPTRIFGVAVIREVSANGLNLFLNSRVKEGTILEVEPRGLNFPRSLLARVVHVVPQANGWVCGCQLANNLSEAELQMLLS
jgi:hypothetical protein